MALNEIPVEQIVTQFPLIPGYFRKTKGPHERQDDGSNLNLNREVPTIGHTQQLTYCTFSFIVFALELHLHI